MLEIIQSADEALFRLINGGMAGSALDGFMLGVSSQYTWITVAMLFLGYAVLRFRLGLVLFCLSLGLTIGLTDFITYRFLKMEIQRERPCHQLEAVKVIQSRCGSDFGFPSNHASNAMATAVTVALVGRRPWATRAALVCAVLIGFSRVYLGVHFPGDVLAGFAVGAVVAYVCCRLTRSFWQRYERRSDGHAGSPTET